MKKNPNDKKKRQELKIDNLPNVQEGKDLEKDLFEEEEKKIQE